MNEYETSVAIKITDSNIFKDTIFLRKDFIYYLKNKNRYCVINNEKFLQKKTVTKEYTVLLYLNSKNIWIPATRKISVESPLNLSTLRGMDVQNIVTRYIIFETFIKEKNLFFRICVEKRAFHAIGGEIYFCGEVEYKKLNADYEKQLLNLMDRYCDFFKIKDCLKGDIIPPKDLINVPSRKFTNLEKKIPLIIVKRKFDGYKAKICISKEHKIMYIDDFGKSKIYENIDNEFNFFENNLFFQLERLPNNNCAVVVDMIGMFYENKFYITRSIDSLLYLQNFKSFESKLFGMIYFQTSVDKFENNNLNQDGYLFIGKNEKEYKCKEPTLDVRLNANGYFFFDFDPKWYINKIPLVDFNKIDIDKIFEIQFHNKELFVIKKREDKTVTSTAYQYKEYKDACDLLNAYGCNIGI